MRARSVLVVRREGGVTVPTRVRGEVPLVIRSIADADGGLTAYLVGGAAGPLGGDDLALGIDVGAGAVLRVRSAAASMALPGPRGSRSRLRVDANVRAGGWLDWWPEPLVSVEGSDHAAHHVITLDAAAEVRWIDEVVLGRHGERGGRLHSRQRLEIEGTPVLDHELVTGGPHHDGPGANGAFRAMASVLTRSAAGGPTALAPVVGRELRRAAFELTAGATLTVALASDRRTAAEALAPATETPAFAWRSPVQFP